MPGHARIRQIVYDIVDTEQTSLPVHLYEPGSTDELPCYVVNRPELAEGDVRATAEYSITVTVLGRTLRDDEAQGELDAAVDVLEGLLWDRKVEAAGTVMVRLVGTTAATTTVANVEIPSYTALIVAETTYC